MKVYYSDHRQFNPDGSVGLQFTPDGSVVNAAEQNSTITIFSCLGGPGWRQEEHREVPVRWWEQNGIRYTTVEV